MQILHNFYSIHSRVECSPTYAVLEFTDMDALSVTSTISTHAEPACGRKEPVYGWFMSIIPYLICTTTDPLSYPTLEMMTQKLRGI